MEFTWFATAWDNDDALFRIGMLAAMLVVIALAASIPDVPDGDATAFALAYVALPGILIAPFARSLPSAGTAVGLARTYLLGGLLWLSSVLVEPPGQYWLWTVGIAVLLTTPVFAVRAYPGHRTVHPAGGGDRRDGSLR